jgi:CubicO group peptidase (beta-lactamase class C family)
MKKKNLIVIMLLVLSISGHGVLAQCQTFVTDELENEIEVLMKENNVPAVGIAIIDNGELSQTMVFGELKKGTPAPSNSIFNIASLTKPISAYLTLTLVSNGDWDLDEPIANYWIDPDVKDDPLHKKLTTRHVLTHQTGFDNWRRMSKDGKLTFNFEPGTKCNYSGEGYEYLRMAMELKFNMPFEELVDSVIFKPLGMNSSSFLWDEKVQKSLYAEEHNNEGEPYNLRKRIVNACAADDVYTTMEEYGMFAVNVMKGTGLSDKVYNDMIRPQAEVSEDNAYGLGWFIQQNYSNGEYA